jgi:hypothetical protein
LEYIGSQIPQCQFVSPGASDCLAGCRSGPGPDESVDFGRDNPRMVFVEAHALFHSDRNLDGAIVVLPAWETGATSATNRPGTPLMDS